MRALYGVTQGARFMSCLKRESRGSFVRAVEEDVGPVELSLYDVEPTKGLSGALTRAPKAGMRF